MAVFRARNINESVEAIFLTQGFVYGHCRSRPEARFLKAWPDEFIYCAHGQPHGCDVRKTDRALEGQRMPCHSSGMRPGQRCADRNAAHGRSVVAARALFGSCLYILGGNPDPLTAFEVTAGDATIWAVGHACALASLNVSSVFSTGSIFESAREVHRLLPCVRRRAPCRSLGTQVGCRSNVSFSVILCVGSGTWRGCC